MSGVNRVFGNESVNEIECLLDHGINTVPTINSEGTVVVLDDFKGASNALLPYVCKNFICSHHRAESIKANLSHKQAEIAIGAIYAKTNNELDSYLKQYNKKTKTYMSRKMPEEQYTFKCPQLAGHSTSQGAESAHNANGELRKAPFGDLLVIARTLLRRFQARRADATKHMAALPPRTIRAHREQQKYAALVPADAVTFHNSDQALVDSAVERRNYMIDFGAARTNNRTRMCDCGRNVGAKGLCRHLLAGARAKGIQPETVMPFNQTTAAWQAGYNACKTLRLPSTAEIESHSHLKDDNLFIPPVIKAPTGRPKKGKRIRSGLEIAQDKAAKKKKRPPHQKK